MHCGVFFVGGVGGCCERSVVVASLVTRSRGHSIFRFLTLSPKLRFAHPTAATRAYASIDGMGGGCGMCVECGLCACDHPVPPPFSKYLLGSITSRRTEAAPTAITTFV